MSKSQEKDLSYVEQIISSDYITNYEFYHRLPKISLPINLAQEYNNCIEAILNGNIHKTSKATPRYLELLNRPSHLPETLILTLTYLILVRDWESLSILAGIASGIKCLPKREIDIKDLRADRVLKGVFWISILLPLLISRAISTSSEDYISYETRIYIYLVLHTISGVMVGARGAMLTRLDARFIDYDNIDTYRKKIIEQYRNDPTLEEKRVVKLSDQEKEFLNYLQDKQLDKLSEDERISWRRLYEKHIAALSEEEKEFINRFIAAMDNKYNCKIDCESFHIAIENNRTIPVVNPENISMDSIRKVGIETFFRLEWNHFFEPNECNNTARKLIRFQQRFENLTNSFVRDRFIEKLSKDPEHKRESNIKMLHSQNGSRAFTKLLRPLLVESFLHILSLGEVLMIAGICKFFKEDNILVKLPLDTESDQSESTLVPGTALHKIFSYCVKSSWLDYKDKQACMNR